MLLGLACCLPAAADLPEVQVRSGGPGGPAIVINGDTHSPLFFTGNNQFNRDDVLLRELRYSAEAGFRLFSFNVWLDWHKTPEETAADVAKFCETHPEGYFYVRIWMGPDKSWLDAHPGEYITREDGTSLNLPSPASTVWREDAAAKLADCIQRIANGPYGDRFIGVHPAYLQTGEWFYPETDAYYDYSTPNERAFRAWLKAEYRYLRAFRKAWHAPDIEFDDVAIPSSEQRELSAWGPFRHPDKHIRAIDYQRFTSDQMADTVAYFARVIKEASDGRLLAGAFYGYTLELNHNGPRALAHSGHLSLARLLECPDIDLIVAPYSYLERKAGDPGHFHFPIDSIALHGKLAIIEEDTYTHLATGPGAELIAPGHNQATTNMDETQAVLRRNFANAFGHKAGFWVFDLLSDGRWDDAELWESAMLLPRMAAATRDNPVFEPQVAVLVDEESVHWMRDTTWPVLRQSLAEWRSEIDAMGTTVGYYLMSDFQRIPDSVRMVILPNPYSLPSEARRAIDRLLSRGGTVVMTYAPGVIAEDAAPAVESIEATTGFDVEVHFDDVPIVIESAETEETVTVDTASWQPRFVIASKTGHVLARYASTGEVSAMARPEGDGVIVYTATPRLPTGLLRWMGARSGVHFYRDTPGMVGLAGPYFVVHTREGGEMTFSWPEPFGAVERIVPPSALPIANNNTTWTDTVAERDTAIYLIRD